LEISGVTKVDFFVEEFDAAFHFSQFGGNKILQKLAHGLDCIGHKSIVAAIRQIINQSGQRPNLARRIGKLALRSL
jgi:hypothetical protein